MKRVLVLSASIFLDTLLPAQDNLQEITKPIVAEGKRLYRSEMASWYGTDVFMERYKKTENIAGYFSYASGDSTKCIFYSKDKSPVAIGTISFDSTFNVETANVDISERNFTAKEFDLYSIRENALQLVSNDSFFLRYKNTGVNLIPLIENGEKKVYYLTGSQTNGVVYFGNDYLIVYNDKNELVSKKRLHQSLIPVEYRKPTDKDENVVGGMHTHLPETGDFMTATDICTIMLYEKIAKWKQHIAVSQNYMSIWNCDTDNLVTITREAMDKIYSNDKKKKEKE